MMHNLPTVKRASLFTPAPIRATSTVDFATAVNGLQHVADPSGQNRRYFEGWASLPGLDMQDMEVAAKACEKGAQAYLERNPVIVWHHQANMPIGRVESLHFTDEGMYLCGVIFNMQEVLDQWSKHSNTIPLDSIALKCEEAWQGIKSGAYSGLSIRGGVREVVPAWSSELDKVVPRVLEVELYEISVTPISIHPGTKITSINTVAKAFGQAIEIAKALDCKPLNTQGETMSVVKAFEAFQVALAAVADNQGNVELPEEVSKGLEAMGFEVPEAEVAKTAEELIAEQQEVIKSMQARMDQMEQEARHNPGALADRRGFTSINTPTEAKVKPTGAQVKAVNVVEKALNCASESYRGRLNFGEGDRFAMAKDDIYKLALIDAAQQGHMSIIDNVNLSPKAQAWAKEQLA